MNNPDAPSPRTLTVRKVDFRDGSRPTTETDELCRLNPGGPPILYRHCKNTSFAVWLATRRSRLKRAFRYDQFVREEDETGRLIVHDGQEGRPLQKLPEDQYWIWVAIT